MPLVFGFDTETHLIAAGDIMPRLVCASFDIAEEGRISPTASIMDTFRAWVTGNGDDHMGGLLPQLLAMFQECYAKRARVVIQNASFDLCVVMRYCQDVIAGVQSGLETILVLSGVTRREDEARFSYQPTRVVESVADIEP